MSVNLVDTSADVAAIQELNRRWLRSTNET